MRSNGRGRFSRIAIVAIAVFSMAAAATAPALADETGDGPSTDLKILDAVFFRPLYAVKFVVGSAAYLVSLPIPYLFGDDAVLDDAREVTIRDTARDLFERPLGDI